MHIKSITVNGTGTSQWIPLDYKQTPFNVGLSVAVTGPIVYDIEHTHDNVMDSSVTPTVFKHPDLQGQSSTNEGYYQFPIRAIRLNNKSGIGKTTLTILQGLR